MSEVVVFAEPGEPVRIGRSAPTAGQGTRMLAGSLLLVGGLLGGTSACGLPDAAMIPAHVLEGGTSNGTWDLGIKATRASAGQTTNQASFQATVLSLRELSGLTWDQLARLFGVSRRALHLWATGGRMNSYHSARLNEVFAVVRSLPAETSERRRELLLLPKEGGHSLYETLLSSRSIHPGANAPAFSPDQLTDALHNRSD
jgi:transcriptional regulator with XRE-family HTH domain